MNSEKNYLPKLKSELKLTAEQLEAVETLASTNFAPRKISKYLDVDESTFMKEWYQKESLVRTHFDRGILLTDFKIAEKLKATAEAGNITATQEFRKIQEANKIEQLKQELFDNEY